MDKIAYFINENYRRLSGFGNHEESLYKLFSLTHLFQEKWNSRIFITNKKGLKINHSQYQGERHTHLDVKEDAVTLKNVASDSEATALASMVFPLPGGPKSSKPVKRSQKISHAIRSFGGFINAVWT